MSDHDLDSYWKVRAEHAEAAAKLAVDESMEMARERDHWHAEYDKATAELELLRNGLARETNRADRNFALWNYEVEQREKAEARVKELEAALSKARETIKRLNRRTQVAEKAASAGLRLIEHKAYPSCTLRTAIYADAVAQATLRAEDAEARVKELEKEVAFWKSKAKGCAWCNGNLEAQDHGEDCPVKRAQRLEARNAKLEAVAEAARRSRKALELHDRLSNEMNNDQDWPEAKSQEAIDALRAYHRHQQELESALNALDGKEETDGNR